VVHPAQQVIRVDENLMASLTLDVRNETHAAAVVLQLRSIEAYGLGRSWTISTHTQILAVAPIDRLDRPSPSGIMVQSGSFWTLAAMVFHSGRRTLRSSFGVAGWQ
jgi:hypothetical protein